MGFIWLALLAFCISLCSAQECSSGCDMGFTSCNIMNYPVYWENKDAVNANETVAAALMHRLSATSGACRNFLTRMICDVMHPACSSSSLTPTPILPCVDMCHDLIQICGNGDTRILYFLAPPELVPYINCTNPLLYQQDTTQECSYLNSTTPQCNDTDSLPPLAWTGACQLFNHSLAPFCGETCAPFVSKMIFVPDNGSDVQYRLDASANITASRILAAKAILPMNCYKYLIGTLCPLVFPTCQMVYVPEYNTTVAMATSVCFELCTETRIECEDFFIAANVSYMAPPCTRTGYKYVYTAPTFEYPLVPSANISATVHCHDSIWPADPYVEFSIPTNVECPSETGKKTKVGPYDPVCSLACPDNSYTKAEWRQLVNLTQIGSAISLVCMAFLIASYMIKADKRRFPATTHIHEFVATILFSVSFLLGGRHPEKNVWCFDEGTYATQSNNITCGVQGFFFIFFGLALAAWCAVIAFTMFYAIVINNSKDTIQNLRKFNKWFLVFGWILPLAFATAAVAAKRIGYGPPLAWCFIHFEGFGYGSGFSEDYSLFYIPAGVLFLLILIMFWITVATIIHIYRHRTNSTESKIFITAQVRVLVFIFVIFAICFTIFEWRFQIEARNNKEDLGTVGIKWTYCRIKVALQLPDSDPADCPSYKRNPARIDFNHTAFESFLLSGIGILIFIAFGSDPNIYKHWHIVLKLLFARDWDKLRAMVVLGNDPFASSRSNSFNNSRGHRNTNSNISLHESNSNRDISLHESNSNRDISLKDSNSRELELYDSRFSSSDSHEEKIFSGNQV